MIFSPSSFMWLVCYSEQERNRIHGQKYHAYESCPACSRLQTNKLRIPEAEGHAWSNPSLTVSEVPQWDHGSLSPPSATACSSEAVCLPVQLDGMLNRRVVIKQLCFILGALKKKKNHQGQNGVLVLFYWFAFFFRVWGDFSNFNMHIIL